MSEEYTADEIYWIVEQQPSKYRKIMNIKFVDKLGLIDEFLKELKKLDCPGCFHSYDSDHCLGCNILDLIRKWEARKNG